MATSRSQTSQNARRNEATASINSANQSAKASRPSSSHGAAVYDEQVICGLQYGYEFLLFRTSDL